MRISALRALRAVSRNSRPKPCRFVAGRRLPNLKPFHTSPSQRREDDPAEPTWNPINEPPIEVARPQEVVPDNEGLLSNPEGVPETPKPKDRNNYGSAARRAGRNIKKVKELPPVHIPPWFFDRNIILQEKWAHLSGSYTQPVSSFSRNEPNPKEQNGALAVWTDGASQKESGASTRTEITSQEATEREDTEARKFVFQLDAVNFREISTAVSAGLQIPQWQRAEITASPKSHLVLFCPKDGATQSLEALGRVLAMNKGIDFLRLNAQDIAEIGGDYLDEPSEFSANTMSSLGYDAPLIAAARYQQSTNAYTEEDDLDESDEEEIEQSDGRPRPVQQGRGPNFGGAIHVSSFSGSIQDVLKSFMPPTGTPQQGKPFVMRTVQQSKDITPELKLGLVIETLLNAPEIKRLTETSIGEEKASPETSSGTGDASVESSEPTTDSSKSPPPADAERRSEGLIVLIQDYLQINMTTNGGKFLEKLHEVVDVRRKEGQKVLIIGTVSSKDLMPSFSRSGVNEVQNEPREGPTRTILTPIDDFPDSSQASFAQELKREIKHINLRHIRDMLRRTTPNVAQVAPVVVDWNLDLDSKSGFLSGLNESVWPMDRVSRVATTALGLLVDSETMTSTHIEKALELIESSDTAKVDWVTKEREHRKKRTNLTGSAAEEDTNERMRKLRKTCNPYEKKLLNGVVNPDDIRTTFADVQAPPSTIDALKTLTSLSLVRPDAFTYGVLATDRIPGLLLYGPPGTGKTLLARAVAKESGATVLEVSGSDVYDMYVGEGEKNVRAIFTLAKKLTPCIVFIDEADAILGARSGGSNRTSHRELINQFLREWDGMTEMSAFIMVATNRPFDLDEASLRRLPRRLLVDLPVEKDREAILKIHLKDEVLDPEVSLAQLASQTPFYSGSDLKNLCVAAALACVREEFETAASHMKENKDGEKYQYPEKRTLHPRHFTKAMEEISASISEDMGSLSAIRKFDEKYGDRKGRRKKGGYGFKTGPENEKQGSDSARVRNQT